MKTHNGKEGEARTRFASSITLADFSCNSWIGLRIDCQLEANWKPLIGIIYLETHQRLWKGRHLNRKYMKTIWYNMYINAACLSSTGASRPCYDVQNKPGKRLCIAASLSAGTAHHFGTWRCKGKYLIVLSRNYTTYAWYTLSSSTNFTESYHFSQLTTRNNVYQPVSYLSKSLVFLLWEQISYSSEIPWGGGFKEGMLPHHVIASYFTITSSYIFILHHTIHHIHFMYPFHTSFFNSIFPPIHLIILHLHFSSHHVSHQKDLFLIFHYHITNYASRRPTTPILVNFFQLWVVFSSNHVPVFQNILVSRTMPGLSSHTATGKFTAQVIHCDLVRLPTAEPTGWYSFRNSDQWLVT